MLMVRIWSFLPAQRFYHSDLANRSVKFRTAPTKARRAVLERDAKNGTDMRKARRGERKREKREKRDAFS